MTPAEIAELAWDRREEGIEPDRTIMDALGLDRLPLVTEDRDVFTELFNERVEPDGTKGRATTTIQESPTRGPVKHVCPECGAVNWWPKHKAGRQEFCGLSCAAIVRNRIRWGNEEAA